MKTRIFCDTNPTPILFPNPAYQVWWIEKYPQIAAMDGKPVPMEIWRKQLQFLLDRGYQLFVWTGGLRDTPAFRALLDEVGKYKV